MRDLVNEKRIDNLEKEVKVLKKLVKKLFPQDEYWIDKELEKRPKKLELRNIRGSKFYKGD
ncbi:MAG TPA: hypothetical protein P5136_00700 [Methanofastidiosum sp.]|nr:hypothetical protein [Methanofastidiosum sp.]